MNLSVLAILRGVGSCCHKGVAVGACKALKMSVEDSPHHAFATTVTIKEAQPSSSTILPLREPSKANPNNSYHSQARILTEEELSLIASGMLPPNYKDLASTSVHLTPLEFHEGL